MTQFSGLFTAIVTPMTEIGEVNEEAFRQVLEFNIQAGAHGFWIAGGSGESILLEDDENRRIATMAVEQVAGRAVTIMHVGAPSTNRAAKLAEHAASAGVDAVCCVPPYFYKVSDKEIVEHYRAVAAAADLPLFVYNIPHCTDIDITPDLMKALQDNVPQLQGLKHSSPNFHNIRVFSEMGLSCFTGSCLLMLPALTIGACGCVDGPPTLAPECWVELWDAYQAGDLRRAEEVQRRAMEIFSVCVQHEYIASLKSAVGARMGVDMGSPRRPIPELTSEEHDDVRRLLDELQLPELTTT